MTISHNWSFEYFDRWEFECKCGCGFDDIDNNLVYTLDKIRGELGFAITVNSGCRCAKHNKSEGGKRNSAHRKGLAADLVCKDSVKRLLLLRKLLTHFDRIGIAKTYIHVDKDPTKPACVWVY